MPTFSAIYLWECETNSQKYIKMSLCVLDGQAYINEDARSRRIDPRLLRRGSFSCRLSALRMSNGMLCSVCCADIDFFNVVPEHYVLFQELSTDTWHQWHCAHFEAGPDNTYETVAAFIAQEIELNSIPSPAPKPPPADCRVRTLGSLMYAERLCYCCDSGHDMHDGKNTEGLDRIHDDLDTLMFQTDASCAWHQWFCEGLHTDDNDELYGLGCFTPELGDRRGMYY